MADIKISIDDLPPATTVYNSDVFVIDQLGGDGYTKKITYSNLRATLGSTFVLKAGDVMTGALLLNSSNPVDALQAASKGYVDAQTSTKISKAGDTMTGALVLNSNSPAAALHAASRGYVQNNFLPISGIGTGEQNTGMTGFLTLCAHPISAFHAATKFYVDNRSGDGSPVGSIVYFAASAAPVGWFACNGASLNRTIYQDLFNVIGYTFGGAGNAFNLPDLRGEFLRGWDSGRNVDAGRVFGSAQADDFKSHTHSVPAGATILNSINQRYSDNPNNINNTGPQTTGAAGGSETRPRNIALLPCIKYATNAEVNYLGLSAQSLLNVINSLSGVDSKSVAKAWVTFTGQTATPGISAFYNITSGTKNSTGNYTFTFTSALSDARYGVFISDNYAGTGAVNRYVVSQSNSNFTVQFQDTGAGGNVYDPPFAYIAIFGN